MIIIAFVLIIFNIFAIIFQSANALDKKIYYGNIFSDFIKVIHR